MKADYKNWMPKGKIYDFFLIFFFTIFVSSLYLRPKIEITVLCMAKKHRNMSNTPKPNSAPLTTCFVEKIDSTQTDVTQRLRAVNIPGVYGN